MFSDLEGKSNVVLGNQKKAIRWVCDSNKGERFNVSVYTPSIVSYSWDYLWQWYGCKNLDCCPSEETQKRFYTIWEADFIHPERLDKWLERQAEIGKIQRRARFGGIGAEERKGI